MKVISTVVIAALALSSTAIAERQAITPSGLPDAIFASTTAENAVSKLANACMNRGWSISSQTSSQLICEIPVNGFKAAMQQMLIGNSYSTTPRSFVRFSVASLADNARAQANAWVETQMALGQMRQQPYQDDATIDNLMAFMIEAGGELPPGTVFPGVYLGINGPIATDGKRTWFQVDKLAPGAAADRGGIRIGDKITSVAGKTFKDYGDFRKKVNKVAAGVQYPVTILRGGEQMTLQLVAETRPAVGTPEYERLKAWDKVQQGLPDRPQP